MRGIIPAIIKLFYPKIEIRSPENLLVAGPIVYVSNHPNGLLDPLALMLGLQRHVSFLSKSTLFAYPFVV